MRHIRSLRKSPQAEVSRREGLDQHPCVSLRLIRHSRFEDHILRIFVMGDPKDPGQTRHDAVARPLDAQDGAARKGVLAADMPTR
jgi:hypothetical protein